MERSARGGRRMGRVGAGGREGVGSGWRVWKVDSGAIILVLEF